MTARAAAADRVGDRGLGEDRDLLFLIVFLNVEGSLFVGIDRRLALLDLTVTLQIFHTIGTRRRFGGGELELVRQRDLRSGRNVLLDLPLELSRCLCLIVLVGVSHRIEICSPCLCSEMIEIFICRILCNRKLLVINLQRKPVHKGKLVANLVDHIGTRFNCNGSRLHFRSLSSITSNNRSFLLLFVYLRQRQRHRRGPVVQAGGGFELLAVPGRNRVGVFLIAILHNSVDDLALVDVICFDGVGDIVGHSLLSGDHSSPSAVRKRHFLTQCRILINFYIAQSILQLSESLCGFIVCHIHLPNDLVIHMGNRFTRFELNVVNHVRLLLNAQIRSLVRILDGERFFFRYIYRRTTFSGSILNTNLTVFDCNRQGILFGVILHPRNRIGRSFLNGVGMGSCGQAQAASEVKRSSVSCVTCGCIRCPIFPRIRGGTSNSSLGALVACRRWRYLYSERRVVRQRAILLYRQLFLNQLGEVDRCIFCIGVRHGHGAGLTFLHGNRSRVSLGSRHAIILCCVGIAIHTSIFLADCVDAGGEAGDGPGECDIILLCFLCFGKCAFCFTLCIFYCNLKVSRQTVHGKSIALYLLGDRQGASCHFR